MNRVDDSREEEKQFDDHLNNLENHMGDNPLDLPVTPLDSNLNSNHSSPNKRRE